MPAMAHADTKQSSSAAAEAAGPRLTRSRSDRIVGGVAAGVGQHLGIDPITVRVAFGLLSFALGFGVVVYLLIWMLAPEEPIDAEAKLERRAFRPTRRQVMGTALIVAGVLVLLWVSGFWFGDDLAWPVSLAAIGFAILWARSGDEGRGRWALGNLGTPLEALVTGRISPTRIVIGSVLILAGATVFLAANTTLAAAGNMLLAVIVTVGGLALVGGPWVWSMGRELVDERSSRIRSEARAEMAAHLHDSVLQTLALIQRAEAPREMVSLARTQERELRAWLYGRAPSHAGVRLRDAMDDMAGRVERRHHVRIEVIVVGNAQLDDHVRALVAACSEATLNAARHSGATEASVYVEVEGESISAYVRDQGAGFDPAAVPDDRRGIADSIVGRMQRHGGTAEVHSRSGAGTEVVLRLPRRVA